MKTQINRIESERQRDRESGEWENFLIILSFFVHIPLSLSPHIQSSIYSFLSACTRVSTDDVYERSVATYCNVKSNCRIIFIILLALSACVYCELCVYVPHMSSNVYPTHTHTAKA